MDRITRKSLKDDRFAAEVTHSVEYLAHHRRQAVIYGGGALVVVALAAGIYFYRQHRENAAMQALSSAFRTFHATISKEPLPGRVTFRTEAEKNAQALKEFEAVGRDFSGAPQGKIARYYVALVDHQAGKTAEAQKQLEKLIAESHDDVTALARLTLADLYLTQGKEEDARKQFDYLMKNPTDTVTESHVLLVRARSLRARQPEEARKLLQELIKRPGPAAAAAGTLLREMGQP